MPSILAGLAQPTDKLQGQGVRRGITYGGAFAYERDCLTLHFLR